MSELKLKAKDFESNQEIKWCPGCGDYAILKQMQATLAELQSNHANTVFISGIGCSSRFPYYLNTYGMHGIHGRATAIASGTVMANPDLDVWIVTGDGDSLSIGGNHFIHFFRRNIGAKVLLFNNEIYGLTKGQYSPTSVEGLHTKSSPYGSLDHSFNPVALALGAEATFIARTLDREPKHMKQIFHAAHGHQGSSFVEIYQNCPVFNDGAFNVYTDRAIKDDNMLHLEEGQPMLFAKGTKGIALDGFTPIIIEVNDENIDRVLIHNSSDKLKATILASFFDNNQEAGQLPRPFGVIYQTERPAYEDLVIHQIEAIQAQEGTGDLDELLKGSNTWTVE